LSFFFGITETSGLGVRLRFSGPINRFNFRVGNLEGQTFCAAVAVRAVKLLAALAAKVATRAIARQLAEGAAVLATFGFIPTFFSRPCHVR